MNDEEVLIYGTQSMSDAEKRKKVSRRTIGEFGDGESHSDAVVCFTCSLRRQVSEEIEGIMLDLQEPEDMHLSSEVFKKVKSLRIVIIRKA